MPDHPGALHRAAEVITRHGGNINRIQFDRRIDQGTVFFELTAPEKAQTDIEQELAGMGYLQTTLSPASFIKFWVFLPHRPGALFEFLTITTPSHANIAYIDFDDRGSNPDRLTVSLNLEDSAAVDRLLEQLKSMYPLEILEYDTTGKNLDDTVFYLRFAQEIRRLVGDSEDKFLLSLLGDVNHIAQELSKLGQDPKEVFENILLTGNTLRETTGLGFYVDIQEVALTKNLTLYCLQPPCGGNIFFLDSPEESLMIDTGYGIYFRDVAPVVHRMIPGVLERLRHIFITHADADHCGAGGYYRVGSVMHPGTLDIIKVANRAYGSRSEASILEEVYTTLINLFSDFYPPDKTEVLDTTPKGFRHGFPIIDTLRIAGVELEILEGRGGHLHGQVYLYSPAIGILFTADTVINFNHLTEERSRYNYLAVFLVTSVNVDSDVAREERKALMELAARSQGEYHNGRRDCLVCGGHGPVSVISGKDFVPFGNQKRVCGE
ncbi:MAG TPA: MBL fold metallo-hydrolase [Methanoregulaceae archaeon]|nr:MBL fold metallo-hydrolase [Methanoregulaceae archaeon]